MNLATTTGIALILSTLIYHTGLGYLYARAHFGKVLSLSRGDKLFTIAKYPAQYVTGTRIVLLGWIVAALAYVMLAATLRDAGDPIISTLASVLFLINSNLKVMPSISALVLHFLFRNAGTRQLRVARQSISTTLVKIKKLILT